MTTAVTTGAPTEAPGPALHQPRRALTAAAELLGAVLLLVAASWTWDRGIRHYSYDAGPDLPQLESTRYFGNWIGGAVVLGVLAGLLVLDAVRQAVLAVRTKGEDGFEHDVDDYSDDYPDDRFEDHDGQEPFPAERFTPTGAQHPTGNGHSPATGNGHSPTTGNGHSPATATAAPERDAGPSGTART
ncbi:MULTISPECIES: hypothetical protein [Actinosynnema]|uniref:hypothetical protein n=1 Tax=Actinosynnema TaxID=40566 RepID=UPI0020A5CECF|nr:hypothetical protein [Actinosynnema pretiosum]MCP2095124.1 hypothetical protein [Actinosynnema pretiosum]